MVCWVGGDFQSDSRNRGRKWKRPEEWRGGDREEWRKEEEGLRGNEKAEVVTGHV